MNDENNEMLRPPRAVEHQSHENRPGVPQPTPEDSDRSGARPAECTTCSSTVNVNFLWRLRELCQDCYTTESGAGRDSRR